MTRRWSHRLSAHITPRLLLARRTRYTAACCTPPHHMRAPAIAAIAQHRNILTTPYNAHLPRTSAALPKRACNLLRAHLSLPCVLCRAAFRGIARQHLMYAPSRTRARMNILRLCALFAAAVGISYSRCKRVTRYLVWHNNINT